MIDISTTAWVAAWVAAGVIAGWLHAAMLRQASHRLTVWTPVLGMVRLAVVGTVLVVAAWSGGVVAAAAGWGVGFATSSCWMVMHRNHRIPVPESGPCE